MKESRQNTYIKNPLIVDKVLKRLGAVFSPGHLYEVFIRDITKRKQPKEDLYNVLETITDGFYVVDKDWRVKYLNKEAERILGLSRNEVINTNIWEVYKNAEHHKFHSDYQKVMTEKVSATFHEYFSPLGKWFEVNAYPSEQGVSVFFKDVTKRVLAEDEVRIAKERYDLVAKATNDAIWDWDLINDKLYWGEGYRTLFGYDFEKEPFTMEAWISHIHPEDRKDVVDSIHHLVYDSNLLKWEKEYRYIKSDGTDTMVFDRGFISRGEDGRPLRMIGAMQDITLQKQVEEEKKKLEIMREQEITRAIIKAQEQERFQIGSELHDNVNQLLATAQLTLGMSQRPSTPSPEEWVSRSKKYIGMAISEIRRISHSLAPASLDEISLHDSFETLLNSININEKYAILLDFDSGPELDQVSSDIQLNLYRILQEQLKNITKYSDASVIEIKVCAEDGMVSMHIADNGKGFDMDSSKKGIGFSNMKKRTELFKGSFVLNASPDEGCVIEVKIPLGL